ncbi:MAG: PRC-barrel domain-containing protein [Patescibacteria group bacterium]|nr:PRC-barrel domain-containing protein [Patescibacteria group bacterium]
MLIKASKVIGLPVFTIKEGKKIEDVNDVIYDPNQQKVIALLVESSGWFSDAKVIMLTDIRSIGPDAIITETENVIKKASSLPEPLSSIAEHNQKVRKTQVVTENGAALGKVSDIFFDDKTGFVEEFEISQGPVEDIKSGRKTVKINEVLRVGKDATIVKNSAKEEVDEQAKKEAPLTGQLKSTQEQAEKSSENIFEEIKTKYEELRGNQSERRKKEAIGQYLTKTILLPNDQVLAQRGEMVTNNLVKKAEDFNLLDQVLDHTTIQPINRNQ